MQNEVNSSLIFSADYDEEDKRLDLIIHKGYIYLDVPPSVYQDFLAADSKGTFYNLYIKGQYQGSPYKIEKDTAPPPSYPICTSIRTYPRSDGWFYYSWGSGMIQGSNDSATSGFVDIAPFPNNPTLSTWLVTNFSNNIAYKFLRVHFPTSANYTGDIAELEFRKADESVITKVNAFGSGYYLQGSSEQYDFNKIFDGNTATFFAGAGNVEVYYGIECPLI